MLFELVDPVGHRLPVVGAELLGTINQGRLSNRRRRTSSSVTSVTIIATTVTAVTANDVARNLGVGADRKQPIIATTRSNRAVEAAVIAVTPTATGRCRRRRGQRRVGRGPVLKAKIFPDRRSTGRSGRGRTLVQVVMSSGGNSRILTVTVTVHVMQRSHRLGTDSGGRGMMTAELLLLLELLMELMLLLFFGRHEQDALRVVALGRSNPRTVRDQLGCGTCTGQRGHAGRVARLRHVTHRAEPLERFRRRGALRTVVVRDAVARGGQLQLQVLLGVPVVRRSGQQQFTVLTQSIEKRRRAGVRAGHVAVVSLGLRVRGLLLVVVHGLLVVRPAVLLQAGLCQVAAGQTRGIVTTTTMEMAVVMMSGTVRVKQVWRMRCARGGAQLVVLYRFRQRRHAVIRRCTGATRSGPVKRPPVGASTNSNATTNISTNRCRHVRQWTCRRRRRRHNRVNGRYRAQLHTIVAGCCRYGGGSVAVIVTTTTIAAGSRCGVARVTTSSRS